MSKTTVIPFTQDELNDIFRYESGVLYWRQTGSRRTLTKPAGCDNGHGYIRIFIAGKLYRRHRIIWFMHHGTQPKMIDHINGVRSDDRIENLQIITNAKNQWKQATPSNNSTGFIGVSKIGNRFRAKICVDYTHIYLGQFDTAEDASKAYRTAKKKHHC